ncbi:metallophosphoesterase family protein [Limosilactobacillus reuteri]|uniref:metallophosphoesterase family protein n=1 Tax=Limosilactobacillus reuteri TaxID=1598 RepID=UPI001E50B207|nr:metallophosphoesterase family protein [Limosilactobacillus reuteri]
MMEAEGFTDSDTNENYRGLIKRYQSMIGQLPSVGKHAEMVSESRLQSIKREIGELNSRKLAMQETGRTVRSLIRQTNKDILLIEEIGNAISKTPFVKADNPVILPTMDKSRSNDMIVCLSDIHYGAHVDIPENYYDTSVVQSILNEYAEKVIALADKENVGRIDVVNLGDIVEHAYMRNQNLFDSEETLSEQIVNVTKLIINFLQELRDHVEIITYRAIAGNHDRMQGDKNSNLNADHAVNISNQIIKMWIELSESDVKFVESDSYFTDISLRGWNFAFVHGDRNSLSKKTTLAELSEQYDRHYDAVIGGHIHHQTMTEVGDHRYQATFGSIKGMDDYSLRLGAKASRSQGVILITDKDFEIRNIQL